MRGSGLPTLTTRGNDLRLQKKTRTRYDLRKFFLLTVVNMWNSLHNGVHAESTNVLRLDKFRSSQEIIYYYHSEIQGTGS